jgi:hypothetical protein
MWTMAKVKDEFAISSFTPLHTYAILKNGEVVGKLAYACRPAKDGGAAWKGTVFVTNRNNNSDFVYYNKDRDSVLEWFKTGEFSEYGEV